MSSATACDCCGVDPLAIACEALVVRALEVLGKRIVRTQRSRWVQLGSLAWHEVHTRWEPSERDTDGALSGAWDQVPALCARWGYGDPERLATQLDVYTRALVTTRRTPRLDHVHSLVAHVVAGTDRTYLATSGTTAP